MDRFWAWMFSWIGVAIALLTTAILVPSIHTFCIMGLIGEFILYWVVIGVLWYKELQKQKELGIA